MGGSQDKLAAPKEFVLREELYLDRKTFTLRKNVFLDPKIIPATPPRVLKNEIYTDPDFFREVDDHVSLVAKAEFTNSRDLIYHLIFKNELDKLQKARAIFQWINLKSLHVYSMSKTRYPDRVLQEFKEGKEGHAETFRSLAEYAYIDCVVISGWIKDENHLLKPHKWNAIHVDGNWQLIDCELASSIDDFYFITPPHEFIYSHFPEDPTWQLRQPADICKRPQFDDYPYTDPKFFLYGLKFLRQNQGRVFTHHGLLSLTFGYTKPTDFSFRLQRNNSDERFFEGTPYERFVLQEKTENRVTFHLRIPRHGKYFMQIFARPSLDCAFFEATDDIACIYKIICEEPTCNATPFPYSLDYYGFLANSERHNIRTPQKGGIILTSDGRINIGFQYHEPVSLEASLTNDEVPFEQLLNIVHLRNTAGCISLTCNLPIPGEYGLKIYGKKVGDWEEEHSFICQYLLNYTDKDFQSLYGKVYDKPDSKEYVRYNYPLKKYNSFSYWKIPVRMLGYAVYPLWLAALLMKNATKYLVFRLISGRNDDHADITLSNSEAEIEDDSLEYELAPGEPMATEFLAGELPAEEVLAEDSSTEHPQVPPASRFTCPICFDNYEEITEDGRCLMSSQCGHIFCETCITDAVENQGRCPTCRNSLRETDIHRIFF